jgi:hypothetical protein
MAQYPADVCVLPSSGPRPYQQQGGSRRACSSRWRLPIGNGIGRWAPGVEGSTEMYFLHYGDSRGRQMPTQAYPVAGAGTRSAYTSISPASSPVRVRYMLCNEQRAIGDKELGSPASDWPARVRQSSVVCCDVDLECHGPTGRGGTCLQGPLGPLGLGCRISSSSNVHTSEALGAEHYRLAQQQ